MVVTLHNTAPGLGYRLLSQTNVAGTNWLVETNVIGATGQDWTPATVPMLGRPHLFFRAIHD